MIINEAVRQDPVMVLKRVLLSPRLSDQYLCERIESIERSLKQKRIVWVIAYSDDPEIRQRLKSELLSVAARFDALSELTLAPVTYEDAVAMILSPRLSLTEDAWARGAWQLPPFPCVLLRDESQTCLGLMSFADAQNIAEERGFDAVVKETQWPPLCVFEAAGSQRYKARKALKEKNRRAHSFQRRVKGCRIRMRIADADLERKVHEIRRHLEKQFQVRVRIQSYGRARKDKAGRMRLFKRVVELVGAAARPGPVTTENVASLRATFIPG